MNKELTLSNALFKALELIKRKPVMVILEFYECVVELKMSYGEYYNYFSKKEKGIKTKEEYELLKEALLWKLELYMLI